MEGDFIKINEWLLPLSWLYGLGVRFRNFLFDVGIRKSHAFTVPIISVGNITVGGTGKTPHVEYLVRLLQKSGKVAVLSRGYKRKTRGYVLGTETSTPRDIGDEPCQMKQKFPDAVVAVDAKRVRAIERLTSDMPDIDVILLDDAFQHRQVKPGVNILLVDYHRLVVYDRLLPAGRLREPLKGKNRADIVIVTKCPKSLTPMEFRVLMKAMDVYPYQHLYFTTTRYEPLQHLYNKGTREISDISADEHILLLTGIASPRQLIEDLKALLPTDKTNPDTKTSNHSSQISTLTFPDHHAFRRKDVERINRAFNELPAPKCIITTEKDAVRLKAVEGLSDEVRQGIYALPVGIDFMLNQEEKFTENIIGYVRKNSRNSILAKRKDDHPTRDGHHPGNGTRTISFRNN